MPAGGICFGRKSPDNARIGREECLRSSNRRGLAAPFGPSSPKCDRPNVETKITYGREFADRL